MIVVNLVAGQTKFVDASRVSTDEHNNLEVWSGSEGEDLMFLCAAGNWVDVSIDDGSSDGANADRD
jgi:hypothetical protein